MLLKQAQKYKTQNISGGGEFHEFIPSKKESYNRIRASTEKNTQGVYISTAFKSLERRDGAWAYDAGLLMLQIRRDDWWFFDSIYLGGEKLGMYDVTNQQDDYLETTAAVYLSRDDLKYIYSKNSVVFEIYFSPIEPHYPVQLIIKNKVINEWSKIYGKIASIKKDKTVYPDCRFIDKKTFNEIDKYYSDLQTIVKAKKYNTAYKKSISLAMSFNKIFRDIANDARRRANSSYANSFYKDAEKNALEANKEAKELLPKLKKDLEKLQKISTPQSRIIETKIPEIKQQKPKPTKQYQHTLEACKEKTINDSSTYDQAIPHYNKGYKHFNNEEYQQAITEFKTALKIKPDYESAKNALNRAYKRLDEKNEE